MKNLRWLVLFGTLVMCIYAVTAETNYPKLDQCITDSTNTLSFQEYKNIEQEIKRYEDTTSTQIVVLMINSLYGESLEDYTHKTFTSNKIGEAKQDNGILLVIAKQDKKVKIEAGHGLQGTLTDVVLSQIIQNEIRPFFEANNYFGGIVTGVDAIARAKTGDYRLNEKSNTTLLVIICAAILIIAAGVIFLRKRNRSK